MPEQTSNAHRNLRFVAKNKIPCFTRTRNVHTLHLHRAAVVA